MIEPTEADIGRAVVYRPHPNAAPDEGVIVRINESYVFVRYGGWGDAKATSHHDLEWVSPSPVTLTEDER